MQLLTIAAAIVLAISGRTNSTPTVAADGQFVAVAWSATLPDGATDIMVAVSRDGARSFGAPVRVNSTPGDARTNGEQPPRIALVPEPGRDPAMTIVWTAKGTNGTRLVSAQSRDGGRTFSSATTVRESDAPGNRGWHNAIAGPQGQVFSVWLDHREMADHQMGAAPAHAHTGGETTDGTAMAQKSKLFIGALEGPVAPHPVTGGVCYCCKTAIAAAGNDVYAAWRHVYPGNLRDIAFSASKDGGRTFSPPVRVSEDRWTLDGCPDDGPAMSVDASRTIHITWPTLVTDPNTGEPTIAIFYATSRDGRSFGARQRLPTEAVAHHPQIVLAADGTPTVAWDESGTGMRRIVVATGPAFRRVVVTPESGGVYPSLTRSEATIVAAWTASRPGGSVVRVERLDAR